MRTKLFGMTAVTILAALSACTAPAAPQAGLAATRTGDISLDAARAALVQAYNTKDYAELCSLMATDASFRGSMKPDQWTIGRNRIIASRMGASAPCGQTAKPLANVPSVPQMILTLHPDQRAGTPEAVSASPGAIAIDHGIMDMALREGMTPSAISPQFTSHRYLMVWRNDGSGWKVTHWDTFAPQ